MDLLTTLGQQAKAASRGLRSLATQEKNRYLEEMAQAIEQHEQHILAANQKDLAQATNYSAALQDRLTLNRERIKELADGLRQVAQLPDPIGQVDKMWVNEEGLQIGQKRVPLGVVGMIYEARPNVTTDAASLCFKSGNCVILRGGKEAFHSNQALVTALQSVFPQASPLRFAIQFVSDTSRELAQAFMQLTTYLDVLIPRGGAGLIQTVVKTATVPVIETGTGNCHIFVEPSADFEKALAIIENAKCQRPSVCNALETLLVHEDIAAQFLPALAKKLAPYHVTLRVDEKAHSFLPAAERATEQDWETEYGDFYLAIKLVSTLDEALDHIERYSTHHSEAILTENYSHAQRFLEEVDSACVYVNASTRFSDGFKFGFGAEIGISTQKLHARGPMGLAALTSTKYIIYGSGQIRP